MRRSIGLVVLLCVFTFPAAASALEARVRLHDFKLATADLSRVLFDNFHLKGLELDAGSIDLTGLRGASFVCALNTALGEGCNVRVDDEALVIHLDPKKLPRDTATLRKAARVFTAIAAPEATASQRRSYGLLLPQHVDPQRPMVVLVHGLDCNRSNWFPMADLLIGEGYQVAYFTYPSDGPLEESADLLTREMIAVRDEFPGVLLHIVAHSMGGLVARRYVEGENYAGGVGHLILLATPNLGSRWAAYRVALEIEEHVGLWKHEKDWSPTWMITDGLGEAGRDLNPTSEFLKQLNERPRREGVAYTIVAGNQHPMYPMAADALDGSAGIIPKRAAQWWGFRQTDTALRRAAEKMRERTGKSDGPVTTKSTRLNGVDDFVTLPASHTSLYYPVDGTRPAAWDVIRDRLAR
jgi:pimeloyl-ACP methyl ester carboxylesterase